MQTDQIGNHNNRVSDHNAVAAARQNHFAVPDNRGNQDIFVQIQFAKRRGRQCRRLLHNEFNCFGLAFDQRI